jgi:hypothetical protein
MIFLWVAGLWKRTSLAWKRTRRYIARSWFGCPAVAIMDKIEYDRKDPRPAYQDWIIGYVDMTRDDGWFHCHGIWFNPADMGKSWRFAK